MHLVYSPSAIDLILLIYLPSYTCIAVVSSYPLNVSSQLSYIKSLTDPIPPDFYFLFQITFLYSTRVFVLIMYHSAILFKHPL